MWEEFSDYYHLECELIKFVWKATCDPQSFFWLYLFEVEVIKIARLCIKELTEGLRYENRVMPTNRESAQNKKDICTIYSYVTTKTIKTEIEPNQSINSTRSYWENKSRHRIWSYICSITIIQTWINIPRTHSRSEQECAEW